MLLGAFDERFCWDPSPIEGSEPGPNEKSYEPPYGPFELGSALVADELLQAFYHFHTEGSCLSFWVLSSPLALANLACNTLGFGDRGGVIHDPCGYCVKVER